MRRILFAFLVAAFNYATAGILPAGSQLASNQSVYSDNGYYRLQMTDTGLTFWQVFPSPTHLWSVNVGSPGGKAVMQTDGNFVVYTANNTPVWQSNTAGTNPSNKAYLYVQNDGNVVVYTRGPIWDSHTNQPLGTYTQTTSTSGVLVPPATLPQGSGQLISANGQFRVLMQSDGNLVIYKNYGGGSSQQALWASHTNGRGAHADMQQDGNFVIYDAAGSASWASSWGSSLYGKGMLPVLWMQDDGNLVVYADLPRWDLKSTLNQPSSGSGGSCPGETVMINGSCQYACPPNQILQNGVCVPRNPTPPMCTWNAFWARWDC